MEDRIRIRIHLIITVLERFIKVDNVNNLRVLVYVVLLVYVFLLSIIFWFLLNEFLIFTIPSIDFRDK